MRGTIASVLGFALGHVLALLCVSVPAAGRAVINAAVRVDPNPYYLFLGL
jgi:hypothetical protein